MEGYTSSRRSAFSELLTLTAPNNSGDNPKDSYNCELRRGVDPSSVPARVLAYVEPLSNPSGSSESSSCSSLSSLLFHGSFNTKPMTGTENRAEGIENSARRESIAFSASDESVSPSEISQSCTSIQDGDGRDKGANGDQQKIVTKKLWEKLAAHRRSRHKLRKDKEVLRRKLYDSSLQLAQEDNIFLSQIRRIIFQDSTVLIPEEPDKKESLLDVFNRLQERRSKHYTLQNRLEDLEDELGREEVGLERAEESFLQQVYRNEFKPGDLWRPAATKINPKQEKQKQLPSDAFVKGIPADRPLDYHPLYSRLLKALARKRSEDEERENLWLERNHIIRLVTLKHHIAVVREREGHVDEEMEFEIRTQDTDLIDKQLKNPRDIDVLARKYDIDEDDVEFLKIFDEREKEFDDILANITAEIRYLRTLCIERRVIPRYPNAIHQYEINKVLGLPTGEIEEEMVEPIFNGNAFVPIIHPGFIPKPPPKWPNDSLSLRHPRFFILLSDPKHVLEQVSVKAAWQNAVKRAKEQLPADAVPDDMLVYKDREVQRCLKEINISSLMLNADPSKKIDYINRWLMHKLRTSTVEMLVLLMVSMTTLSLQKIAANWAAWQQDVARFWTRDDASNIPAHVFERRDTSTLSLSNGKTKGTSAIMNGKGGVSAAPVNDAVTLSRQNSGIQRPSSMKSDFGPMPRQTVDDQAAAHILSHHSAP